MRSTLRLMVAMACGATLGRLFDGAGESAAAEGGQGGGVEPCAARNGDVNADRQVNLADAVTILGHLFQGSPAELAPLCAGPVDTARLPATGQSTCYSLVEGTGWVVAPCDTAACLGQDGASTTGCPAQERFIDNGDGTVSDRCTGLMWQQSTADVNGDDQAMPEDDSIPWCDAQTYCAQLKLAGHDDWRLPNVRELQSLVDYGRFNTSIDPTFFDALSGWYWSSTAFASNPKLAWNVNFGIGIVNSVRNDLPGFVRAVRGGE